jgi:hypothetical protein
MLGVLVRLEALDRPVSSAPRAARRE